MEQRSRRSSSCESGWTTYFHQSDEGDQCTIHEKKWVQRDGNNSDDEEDLSMVSDASSGPPPQLLHEDESTFFCYVCCSNNRMDNGFHFCYPVSPSAPKRRVDGPSCHHQDKAKLGCGLLDDTASSHLSSFPESNFGLLDEYDCNVGDVLEDTCGGFSTAQLNVHNLAPFPYFYPTPRHCTHHRYGQCSNYVAPSSDLKELLPQPLPNEYGEGEGIGIQDEFLSLDLPWSRKDANHCVEL